MSKYDVTNLPNHFLTGQTKEIAFLLLKRKYRNSKKWFAI